MFSKRISQTAIFLLSGLLLAVSPGTVTAEGVESEVADVMGQGAAGPVVAANGARLLRSDTGITISLRMPTPEPGTYSYPPGNPFNPPAVPGHPEVFSLWAFIFNFPEDCEAPVSSPTGCDLADFVAGRGAPGAFNVAGHVVGGSTIQMSGHVSLNSEQFGGTSRLLMPRTAEVHVALAPHGVLQPGAMPNQIKTPIGGEPFWWLAFFLPD